MMNVYKGPRDVDDKCWNRSIRTLFSFPLAFSYSSINMVLVTTLPPLIIHSYSHLTTRTIPSPIPSSLFLSPSSSTYSGSLSLFIFIFVLSLSIGSFRSLFTVLILYCMLLVYPKDHSQKKKLIWCSEIQWHSRVQLLWLKRWWDELENQLVNHNSLSGIRSINGTPI